MQPEIQKLLERARLLLIDQAEVRQKAATRFNVFDVLGLQRSELDHSVFLAFLLNPRAAHDQGAVFLESFLRLVGINVPDKCGDAEVLSEYSIGSYGQLDIMIRVRRDLIVCIENKVDANDQEDQIRRYLNWLSERNADASKTAVVYLTPTGRKPKQATEDERLWLLSYKQVSEWLKGVGLPKRLEVVCLMYAATCSEISRGTSMETESDELTSFLANAENLPVSLEIESRMELVKRRILDTFAANVRRCLDSTLMVGETPRGWRTWAVRGQLWLRPERYSDSEWVSEGISLAAAISVRDLEGQTFLGICKPREFVPPKEAIGTVVAALQSIGYRTTKSVEWYGWRWCDGLGFPASNGSAEGLVRLNEDNHEGDNPLAQRLASEVVHLLTACVTSVEALNNART